MCLLGKYHIVLNFWSHVVVNCKGGICRVIRIPIDEDLRVVVTRCLVQSSLSCLTCLTTELNNYDVATAGNPLRCGLCKNKEI